ncbi:TetR/AcrR family transcriptional regulator [Pseudonocardia humida]|uniref:TetR family transcriptional regulator n=1 Tax=Pseudonocardia humida TaxID=2800819 RepID=A0ABT1A4P0_9PSEU|nr:TetR/AcrR family transcriptional regulator [Pseudonocardia humida]MCO1657971.1 TetR family transcriptional regulator [Pseudonocardia humida]
MTSSDLIWMRPEGAGVGRPASRSRAEITEAAVRVADRDGLAGVSMRHVAAELGTGAGSLYRYVDTREDLLDLMADHVAGEYRLGPPTGSWLDDLVDVGLQAREIYRRHPWLPELVLTRPVAGPNGLDLAEHVLAVLADHPAPDGDKVVALALLNAVVAANAQFEASSVDVLRGARYLAHVVARGEHPHLAAIRLGGDGGDPLPTALRRVLGGLLPVD